MSALLRHRERLRLPVHGRELLDARTRGLVPERGWNWAHVIVVLDDWRLAARRFRLVIAPEVNPQELDFTSCAGLDVVLCHDSRRTHEERLRHAIQAILRGLPAALQVFDVFQPHRSYLVKSRTRGIEIEEFL